MFSKKHIMILLLVTIAIGCISDVCASDTNMTEEIGINTDMTEISLGENTDDLVSDGDESADDNDDYSNSRITLSQSGTYAGDKIIQANFTDLNGNPLADKEISFDIYSQDVEFGTDDYYFNMKTVKTNANGIATYKWNADFLPPGTYKAEVNSMDWDYVAGIVELNDIKVVKKSITIKPTALTTTYKSEKNFKIRVVDSNGFAVSGVELELTIYTGKKTITRYVTTDSNGYAYYKAASKLSKGTHKVIISTSNACYSFKTVKSSIKVKAKKLYIAGESNKFKHCGQIIIGAYDKQNKELVSGIKLQIKIFTGKKYKTFNLVTKYSKFLDAVGVLIETNKFSTGTHKITVKITSPNYSGFEKGKFKIPKSAKNYDKFTLVITNGKTKYL